MRLRSWLARPASFLLTLTLAVSASASPFDNRPKLLLHVAPTTTTNACAAGLLADCSSANTAGGLYPGNLHYVYLLAARGNLTGAAGFQCGIMYEENCPADIADQHGIDILSWRLCAQLEFPSPGFHQWPRPGGGNLITWNSLNNCQTGGTGVAGYFYVAAYGPDRLQITTRPVDNRAVIANCQNVEFTLQNRDLGSAEFSAGAITTGCNPCNQNCPDPVIPVPPADCPPPPPPPDPEAGTPKILLHVASVTSKNSCVSGLLAACSDAVVRGSLDAVGSGPYHFVYLLAARRSMPTFAALQCGIAYENGNPTDDANLHAVDVFSWTLCATLEFITPGPNQWPKPGGGNLITWDAVNNCQLGATAVAGFFYMAAYDTDVMRVTPRPVDGFAKVANCSAAETNLTDGDLGYATFSPGALAAGCNPCVSDCGQPIPVEPATWSGIKTLYSR